MRNFWLIRSEDGDYYAYRTKPRRTPAGHEDGEGLWDYKDSHSFCRVEFERNTSIKLPIDLKDGRKNKPVRVRLEGYGGRGKKFVVKLDAATTCIYNYAEFTADGGGHVSGMPYETFHLLTGCKLKQGQHKIVRLVRVK
jgi:hypothetical protein